jgi:hypothetical protein
MFLHCFLMASFQIICFAETSGSLGKQKSSITAEMLVCLECNPRAQHIPTCLVDCCFIMEERGQSEMDMDDPLATGDPQIVTPGHGKG